MCEILINFFRVNFSFEITAAREKHLHVPQDIFKFITKP